MSCNRSFLILILFFLSLLTTTAARVSNPSSFGASSPRNHPDHHKHPDFRTGQSHSCGSFPGKTSQNLCIQFQILNQQQRFRVRAQPTPPALSSRKGDDKSRIDPRYGVEKRLVPSGPNPLHN